MDIDLFKKKTNNMKLTAIKWLLKQLQVCNYISKKGYKNAKTWLIQEALEYEQEQQDEFTISFVEWCNKLKASEIDTNDYDIYLRYDIKELLEIYKKEKGL
jgi:hypothetical protein